MKKLCRNCQLTEGEHAVDDRCPVGYKSFEEAVPKSDSDEVTRLREAINLHWDFTNATTEGPSGADLDLYAALSPAKAEVAAPEDGGPLKAGDDCPDCGPGNKMVNVAERYGAKAHANTLFCENCEGMAKAAPVTAEGYLKATDSEKALRPTVVCLCGSTRFMDAFQEANLRETIAGRIVLSVGCNTKSDSDLIALGELTEEAKAGLDELHKRKIDIADEVFILNVGGYIGSSTKSELEYAKAHGKRIRFLEADLAPPPQSADAEGK